MTDIFYSPISAEYDGNGKPYSGGKMAFYTQDGTELKAVFQNEANTIEHANPVIADASGRFPVIWTGEGAYNVKFSDSSDVLVWSVDDYGISTTPALGLNYVSGLAVTNGTDTQHDIDVAVGSISDSTNTQLIELTTAITKQIDANWVEGDGNGGFPSGLTLAADTAYRVFIIQKPDGTTDCGFDTSSTASNLLSDASGYTLYRRIGWVITDSSSNIINWVDGGNRSYIWDVVIDDESKTSLSTTGSSLVITAPPNQVAKFYLYLKQTSATTKTTLITQTDQTNTAPSASLSTLITKSDGTLESTDNMELSLRVDSISNLRYRVDTASAGDNLRIHTAGWKDDIEVS